MTPGDLAALPSGEALGALLVAFARCLPVALLVPAFGLGFLPTSARAAMGLALAVSIVPSVRPEATTAGGLALALARAALEGVPVAVSASVALWAAVTAGGVADAAILPPRGTTGHATPRPLATLLGLAVAVVFLRAGGATVVAARLVAPGETATPLARATRDLAAGVGIGASIGAPLLLVGLVVDLATGVVVRELPSLHAGGARAGLRSLVVLVGAAALFDRMAEAAARLGP